MAIHRGEIYFVNLNPVKGKEQAGNRPVLVLSVVTINNVVGTIGENISRDYPTNVRVPITESGLSMETVFLCFQLRSIDAERFSEKPAGKVSIDVMEKIEHSVRYCLGL